MMHSQKKSGLLLVVSIGIAVVFILFGPLGMTATVQAAPEVIQVAFTDTNPIQYTDLSGNVIGEGMHVGDLHCIGDNCNQKIEFEPVSPQPTTDTVVFEYRFKSRQAFDPAAERVVVSGTGTMINSKMRIKFSFTGVFQNNGDGTVRVTYFASAPDAAFIFPAAPAMFSVSGNN